MNHIRILFTIVIILILTVGAVDAGTGIPERVISLSPIVTETIFLLGAQDRLIADTTYCNTPEAAKQKEKIGTVTRMNIEKILSLRPDLVIGGPLSPEDQLMTLERRSIEVIRIQNPKTFSEMCEITLHIGQKLGRETAARQVIAQARKEVEDLYAKVRELPKPKVFFQLGANPLHAVNRDKFMNEYIRYGGGINITENDLSGICGLERVVAENPDIILISIMGTSRKAAEAEKEKWMGFKHLTAAKQNRIFVVDPEMICSPTPSSFASGLKYLLPLIHPEALP
jgi:iron complex transport system substrate-binding protein